MVWEDDSHQRAAAEFKLVQKGAKQNRILVELEQPMFWELSNGLIIFEDLYGFKLSIGLTVYGLDLQKKEFYTMVENEHGPLLSQTRNSRFDTSSAQQRLVHGHLNKKKHWAP